MDIFKRQMTSEVNMILNDNNICLANIPPNMTKYYQPLDLMVNGHAKHYLKNKFSTWYRNQILKQLDEGVNIDAVDVKLRLTTLKPLHAQWVVDFYNKNLPAIDPFHDIDLLLDGNRVESQQLQVGYS